MKKPDWKKSLALLLCLTMFLSCLVFAQPAADAVSDGYAIQFKLHTTTAAPASSSSSMPSPGSGSNMPALTILGRGSNGTGAEDAIYEGEVSADYFTSDENTFSYSVTSNQFPTRILLSYTFVSSFSVAPKWEGTVTINVNGTEVMNENAVLEASSNGIVYSGGTQSTQLTVDSSCYPTVDRIEFDVDPFSYIVVPKPGAQDVRIDASAEAYDQYGVQWYCAPVLHIDPYVEGVQLSNGILTVTSAANSADGSDTTFDIVASCVGVSDTYSIKLVNDTYEYRFLSGSGEVISRGYLKYGQTPEAPSNLQKGFDDEYHYLFAGWSPAVGPLQGDTTYLPVFSAQSHNYIFYSNKDATCTADGTATGYCTECPHTVTIIEEGSAHGHEWDETDFVEPTCVNPGYIEYTCMYCDMVYYEELEPSGDHDFEPTIVAPTCTEQGYTQYTCVNCQEYYRGNYTQALGHDYDEGVVTSEPGCTEEGVKLFTCSRCGKTRIEAIAALGHDCLSYSIQEPTCTQEGCETFACARCGGSFMNVIPATGHAPMDAVIENEKAATCTEAGGYDEVVYCATCHEELSRATKEIPATGHTPAAAVIENEKAATCTEAGSYDEVIYCATCHEKLSRATKEIPATGHTPAELLVQGGIEATCTEDGVGFKYIYCAECNEEITYTEFKIPALGHDYTESVTAPTCTEQGYTTHVCSRCNDTFKDNYTEALGHDFSENAPVCHNGCGTVNPDYVASPAESGAFEMNEVKTRAGKTVSVDLDITANPGITALSILVEYPAGVKLTNVEYHGLFNSAPSNSGTFESPFRISWFSGTSSDETATGRFATLTFEVADDTAAGDYPISICYDAEDVFNSSFENQPFDIHNGKIIVVDSIPGDVNGDGKINMKDIVLLQQYINNWDVTIDEIAANVNGDSSINMKDIVLLQQYFNGWDVVLK